MFKSKRSFDYKIDKNSSLDFFDEVFFEIYKINENSSLDFFEMVANTNKPSKEVVNWEFFIFQRYKMFLEWWRKHETMFPFVGI